MTRALLAGLACLLIMVVPARAGTAPVAAPFLQSWSDTGQIEVDDDWSGVGGIVGYRGDGLVAEPGTDPRTVTADGSSTPLDVSANRTDPRAVGLASGVAEFELADPVVAIQGSATAGAPHLLLSLDTRGRTGVSVRLVLRDIDASTTSDAVEPVSLQYRVGASGDFTPVPGGYVADATSGPGQATLVTPVHATLPSAADGQPLVEVRVITTNAAGQDEWVGIDDIEVTATPGGGAGTCPAPAPPPASPPEPDPGPLPRPPGPRPPRAASPELTELALAPDTFMPAKRGPALTRRGRAGAALRFRLSRPALVRFEVIRAGGLAARTSRGGLTAGAGRRTLGPARGGRFALRGRRGPNRLRFSGRVRGRPLAAGTYVLRAVAVDRAGRGSAPVAVRFRIGGPEDRAED